MFEKQLYTTTGGVSITSLVETKTEYEAIIKSETKWCGQILAEECSKSSNRGYSEN